MALAFNLALQHHQAGRLAEAEAGYRQILAIEPDHVEVIRLLGLIAFEVGRHEVAAELFNRSVALNPNDPEIWAHLGDAYNALGHVENAVAAYRRVLALNSTAPRAHNNLGVLFSKQGLVDEAIVAYRRAIELQPDYAAAHNNLGIALAGQGLPESAIIAYRYALRLNPAYADAHDNLANALKAQGGINEAIGEYRQALQFKPDYFDALLNLATSLLECAQPGEVVALCRRALQLKPDHPEVLRHLGTALGQMGCLDEAVGAFERALELKPGDADLWNNLGRVQKDQGRVSEAVATFRRALECNPKHAFAHDNLIYSLLFDPSESDLAVIKAHQGWNSHVAEPEKRFVLPHNGGTRPERALRVGYVSADLCDHVVGRNLLRLFEHHDRAFFEIFCYSGVMRRDRMEEQFREHADQWRSTLGLTDDALANLIRDDHVDLLVDLSQHLAGNRLAVFDRQPASIQVSFAGYPETTGVETIEYRISDPYLESEPRVEDWQLGWKRDFETAREHVYLIDSFWCYDPCGMEVAVNELPAKKTNGITFGCLNNFCKVNEPLLKLWARVLAHVPDSRLLMLTGFGSHCQRTLDFLENEGVVPDRIEFVAPHPRKEYLELYHRLDIVLDTFPYNGHTTSLDALWMGVPVVSLVGGRPVSRGGLSQLSNLSLRELVAFTEDDYVSIAVALAKDLPRLEELRRTLRSRMESSILMDGPRFARNIEAAYRAMWRRWCAQPS